MAQVLVIADDVTGANATGAGFARDGMRTATVTAHHVARCASDYDVLVVNTDSRHLPPNRAGQRVADAVAAAGPARLVVKRTDTTLRGNVGSELAAALRTAYTAVESPPARVRALLAPAHPRSGRVTVDGVQLLGGVRLEDTELAIDPECPMRTSVVTEILAEQTDLAVRHVPVGQVTAPGLVEALAAGDEPVVLADAVTEDHLRMVADAAAEVSRRDGTAWLAVDPGPFGAFLAKALALAEGEARVAPVLAIVGSATTLTRRQWGRVADDATFVDVDVRRMGSDPRHRGEVVAVLAEELRRHAFPDVVVLRTASTSRDVVDLPRAARQDLPATLAAMALDAFRLGQPPSGLLTTGGSVTAAVLEHGQVRAFEVGGEVVPLAVFGTLNGGVLDGTPVVTKGGLIGEEDTVVACLDTVREAVRAGRRRVSAQVRREDERT